MKKFLAILVVLILIALAGYGAYFFGYLDEYIDKFKPEPKISEIYYDEDDQLVILFDDVTMKNLGSSESVVDIKITDGRLFVEFYYEGVLDLGSLVGLDGSDGKSLEIDFSNNKLLWKYDDETEYRELFDFDLLIGPKGANGSDGLDGKALEFIAEGNKIMYRYKGDTNYEILFSLDNIELTNNNKNTITNTDANSLINSNYLNVYEEIKKSVVSIYTYKYGVSSYTIDIYSGAIVSEDLEYAYIYTTSDALGINSGSSSVEIEVLFYNNMREKAEIVYYDYYENIGVIKVPKSDNYTLSLIGNSNSVNKGDTLFTVSQSLNEVNRSTFNVGSLVNKDIAYINRDIETNKKHNVYFMEVDMAVNKGGYGGPLFNKDKELVGVISRRHVKGPYVLEGFQLAIPINHFNDVVDKISVSGNDSYTYKVLGLLVTDLMYISSMESMERFSGINQGLYVNEILSSSLNNGIIQAGDIIIKLEDNKIINKTMFNKLLREQNNNLVNVTVLRAGVEVTLELTLKDLSLFNEYSSDYFNDIL